MNPRKGPPAKKFGPYVPEQLIAALSEFSGGNLSDATRGAILAWMALDAGARELLDDASRLTNAKEAVRRARAIIKQSVRDQILLDYAKELPGQEQARIIQKSIEK